MGRVAVTRTGEVTPRGARTEGRATLAGAGIVSRLGTVTVFVVALAVAPGADPATVVSGSAVARRP